MKIIFFGTGAFGIPALQALKESRHDLSAVITSPEKPQGRHLKPSPSPVKSWALKHGLRVLEYSKSDLEKAAETPSALAADVFVVISYGVILKRNILELPRVAALNVHASLLPLYRGAGPIHRALMDGARETGVTVIRMTERLDAGEMLVQKKTAIAPEESVRALHDRLAVMGAAALTEALDGLEKGDTVFVPQEEARATAAGKISKEDGHLDWGLEAGKILNRVRALSGWPGCYFFYGGRRVIVIEAGIGRCPIERPVAPGGIVEASPGNGLWIAAKDRPVEIRVLQMEGKKPMPAGDFLRGFPMKTGAFVE